MKCDSCKKELLEGKAFFSATKYVLIRDYGKEYQISTESVPVRKIFCLECINKL